MRSQLIALALTSAYYCFFNPLALAADVTAWASKAKQQNLHQEKVWQQLMHYLPSNRSPTGIESQIDDDRYFLAADGKTNPQAELIASIEVLLSPNTKPSNESAHCRFVSRTDWLREQFNLEPMPVPQSCSAYHDWRKIVGSHRMSLVFPASYLNSPSSMFGHTLLRFDSETTDEGSDWLSWSLNFAADTGSEDFSAGYAFKGIAGGYIGKFNSIPYFKKLQEYGAIENRDIWEYQLDFTPTELDRLLDHAWELRDIGFDYYFFRQNCSYRLLELMDYARPGLNLTEQFKLTTIPADTVKAVANAGLINERHYRPSLGTGIQARYQTLPRSQRHWVERIANNPATAQSDKFNALDMNTRAQIARVANDVITYRSRRAKRSPEVAKRRLALLRIISELPVEESEIAEPSAPEIAHDTRTISIGLGRADKLDYKQLGIRWSYHDFLDRSAGYLKGAGIVLGDLRVRRDETGKTQLQGLELVTLQSLSDRALLFRAISWNLSVGFARNEHRLDGRLAGRVGGSIGKSTEILPNTVGYALLGASASQYSRFDEHFADAQVQFGFLHHVKSAVTQFELKLDSQQDESLRKTAFIKHNLPLSRNQALRLSYSWSKIRDDSTEQAQLDYRFYF